MVHQVTKEAFVQALAEMGHDPKQWEGQKITLDGMAELYEMEPDSIIEAIDANQVRAHYDYGADTIWIDALDAAHFFYCLRSQAVFY